MSIKRPREFLPRGLFCCWHRYPLAAAIMLLQNQSAGWMLANGSCQRMSEPHRLARGPVRLPKL